MSGHERNRLFLNRGGVEFVDASGVSGLDDPADGRAFGILDYDRDGYPDLAVVNANAPWVELFRNRAGLHPAVSSSRGRMLALRFVGGNHTPYPSETWSARDGLGAVATVEVDGRKLVRELRAGEGFASQNSSTLIVGLGSADEAQSLGVRWPSGVEQAVAPVRSGSLVTVYENPDQSPTGEAFVVEPYGAVATRNDLQRPSRGPTLQLPGRDEDRTRAQLLLYTTMATWCVACREELPQLARLRQAFDASEIAMYGVPIDLNESPALVEAWAAENDPAYVIRTDLGSEDIHRVKDIVLSELKLDAVPATLVAGAAGNVLRVQWGPPSLSKLRELLHAVRNDPAAPSPLPTLEKASIHP